MTTPEVHRPHPEAPARALLRASEDGSAWPGARADRFEVVSRGDFVPGRLHRPGASEDAALPLLLLVHDGGDDMRAGMDADALAFHGDWVRQGLAVATIDLPLHGERASPKLSERLGHGLARLGQGESLDPETWALVQEFARQSTSDLIRTLDALAALPDIDAERLAFMGIGAGATTGTYLLAHDARVRAAVLAFVRGGGRGSRELDPALHLARSRAASLLLLHGAADDPAERKAAQACFDAAPEPKQQRAVQGRGSALAAEDRVAIWDFLSDALQA